MSLQYMIVEYLESKGWYFDWDHINAVWGSSSPTSLNKRPDAIRVLHGWTMPQWGDYWSYDNVLSVYLDGNAASVQTGDKRRYECLKDALWSQLLREEEPERYEHFYTSDHDAIR